jgi:HEAT repeat protein
VVAMLAATARADKVDDLSRQLRSDPDYKVRLSAALNLGKLRDRRGADALVDALRDSDRTVRSVAAAALAKVLDKSVPPDDIARAVDALDRAAKTDSDSFVRDQARKTWDDVHYLVNMPSLGRGVYVEVGPMADATKKAAAVLPVMRQQMLTSLGKRAPAFLTRWPSGRPPTDLELKRDKKTGFYIDGSIVGLTVSKAPPHVACSLSVLLATYPDKSIFGFLRGGAEVDAASTSDAAINEATSDCVGAVLDDLVASRLVPTIQSRLPGGM